MRALLYYNLIEQRNCPMSKAEQVAIARCKIRQFRAELLTPKFVGVDSDGSRKDWMSTKDIDSRLLEIFNEVL